MRIKSECKKERKIEDKKRRNEDERSINRWKIELFI